ncbi:MAG: helix-turn-helix transcriptional regulator [Eggerthellaceae bacterium]|nr:helix-turn-helix transcriptional regulator [Eggerthellaceae bacterium]
MNNAYKQCLGEVLAERRRAAKINKRQLSMMVGISRLTIRKIENGDTNPSIDVLLRMTQGMGVPFADIVAECESRLRALPEDSLDEPYVLTP